MIEILASLVSLAVDTLKMEVSVLGFSFSIWGLMIYGLIASIIIDLIGRFLNGK